MNLPHVVEICDGVDVIYRLRDHSPITGRQAGEIMNFLFFLMQNLLMHPIPFFNRSSFVCVHFCLVHAKSVHQCVYV